MYNFVEPLQKEQMTDKIEIRNIHRETVVVEIIHRNSRVILYYFYI